MNKLKIGQVFRYPKDKVRDKPEIECYPNFSLKIYDICIEISHKIIENSKNYLSRISIKTKLSIYYQI